MNVAKFHEAQVDRMGSILPDVRPLSTTSYLTNHRRGIYFVRLVGNFVDAQQRYSFKEQVASILATDSDNLGVAYEAESRTIVVYRLDEIRSLSISSGSISYTRVDGSKVGRRRSTKIDLSADLRETPRFPSEMYEAEQRVW